MLKIERDISEQQAFFNCLKFIETTPHFAKDECGVFSENYLKWLLNKFDLPFCYLEQKSFDNSSSICASAQRDKGIVFIDYENLSLFNLHEYTIHLAHELTHVSDFYYYASKYLLGKDRQFQSYNGSFKLAQTYNLKPFTEDEDYVNYFLKDEEISARTTGNFYAILFCKLVINSTKEPRIKNLFLEKLQCILNYSALSEQTLTSYEFTESKNLMYLSYIETIRLMANKAINNFETQINSKDVVKEFRKAKSLILTSADEKMAKNLVKAFNKSERKLIRTFILQTLADLPFDVMPESSINSFLLNEETSLKIACSYCAPKELAQRLLFLWGNNTLKKEVENCKQNIYIARLMPYFEDVLNEFKNYNIIGLKNVQPSIFKKLAEKKFINSKNFTLSRETLEKYNFMLGGKLCNTATNQNFANSDQEKIK